MSQEHRDYYESQLSLVREDIRHFNAQLKEVDWVISEDEYLSYARKLDAASRVEIEIKTLLKILD